MNTRIKIPSKISFTKCKDVTSFLASQTGKVKIIASAWHKIDFSPGSASLEISNQKTPSGYEYRTNLNCKLKKWDRDIWPAIVKVEFCEGEALIIGSLDLPVHFERGLGLIIKRLEINHSSWHFPYEYTP